MAERVTIERLGAKGDGVAPGPVFVPYALPGETVRVTREGPRAAVEAVETSSSERAEPFCPYFGACGGCAAQHMSAALYGAWKRGIVAGALEAARLAAPLADLVDAHGAGRRRITLHARWPDGATHVGYMAARSHALIDIAACPIAEPALAAAPAVAKALAGALARSKKPLDIQVTTSEAGFDVDLRGHGPVGEGLRQRLVALANELDLARLAVHGDVVVERRPPWHAMGRAQVVPPAGAFLQATRAGEEILSALVMDACKSAKRVADLFAGCGPFSLRLAQGAEVHAVEGEDASLKALDRAARGTPGLRRVTVETRDLFRRPLLPLELDRYDAVVIDPPRAGAEAQARQLAASKVPVVASVSCDPGTFARDAGLLVAGGYELVQVTPVDQFKYSPHVELVGIFCRPGRKRR
ncbi:MAG TPA: RNA methyltransferase [Beijerinckiaceae bacterium]